MKREKVPQNSHSGDGQWDVAWVGRWPISVIFIIPVHEAKVFERILYDQLYNVLINEDKLIIILTNQSGFRFLNSTVTALLEATNNRA